MVAAVVMNFANTFLPSGCPTHKCWLRGLLERSIIKGTMEPVVRKRVEDNLNEIEPSLTVMVFFSGIEGLNTPLGKM